MPDDSKELMYESKPKITSRDSDSGIPITTIATPERKTFVYGDKDGKQSLFIDVHDDRLKVIIVNEVTREATEQGHVEIDFDFDDISVEIIAALTAINHQRLQKQAEIEAIKVIEADPVFGPLLRTLRGEGE